MFAMRKIIENPYESVSIPPELRNRRIEVIFIAMDEDSEQMPGKTSTKDIVDAFRGKGKGGAVARLLEDRQYDREKEG